MGIIIKPIFTEKQTEMTDKFENRYGFIVTPTAYIVYFNYARE